MDYLIPDAFAVPAAKVIHMETPPAVSVSGFKGMAEGGTIGAIAAVANAVADALAPLGLEVRELPVSPDRLLRLMRARRLFAAPDLAPQRECDVPRRSP
jgi:aerobic carbon-monoxide dehydrogenase large subunit